MAISKRLPRFERAELGRKTILTERDHEILRAIETHSFLRSSQIVELVGGSGQQVRRRLQRLFHLGRLARPKSQIDYYHSGGSREMVYALPSKKVQRFYLEHALLTSDISLAFHRLPGTAILELEGPG